MTTQRRCYQCDDGESLEEIRARRREQIRAWNAEQIRLSDQQLIPREVVKPTREKKVSTK